ncbi:hypothetical protein [Streptomyces celluloflavus]|uniref:hypothetical protein n=1 Tax=Streptomyces celluloflavus TaxID=58344 RepID=UPI0036AB912B
MGVTPVQAQSIEELCKRLHDALKAAGILVDPPLIAAISTHNGALVDKIAPPTIWARKPRASTTAAATAAMPAGRRMGQGSRAATNAKRMSHVVML